jgi:NitT/TauT family transport system permease protein
MNRPSRRELTLARLGLLVTILAAWEATAQLRLVPPLILPSLSGTLAATLGLLVPGVGGPLEPDAFYGHFGTTLFEVGLAYACAAVTGLGLGVAFGIWRRLGTTVEPLIAALAAVPAIVFYPVLYLGLGLGSTSKIAFGALVGFLPILTATLAGIRGVDRGLVRTAEAFGASRRHIVTRVLLPAAAPVVVAGLRLGFNLSLIGVFAGELIASFGGLGYLIKWAGDSLRTPVLFALVLVTLVVAVAGNQTLLVLEHRLRRA